ncbi:MAG TPA: RNA-binding protein [Desulfosporosinus sp.]|nr:RNA-binding protein [Desulfosporosinus sp.]
MTTTLYVGNLPWNTTADELGEFFGQYGQIESSRIITDRETGRSRGFGFIEVDEADAVRLAEELNGKDFGGRPLTVNEAKPKQM